MLPVRGDACLPPYAAHQNDVHYESDEDDDPADPPSHGSQPEGLEDEFDPDDVNLLHASRTWNTAGEVHAFPSNSPMVFYTKQSGAKVPINKSTLCWVLEGGLDRLSSDRLVRVQQGSSTKDTDNGLVAVTKAVRRRTIATGEWCAFQEECNGELQVGRVLSFRYLSGSGREQLYSLPSAPVCVPEGVHARGLGVLCSLFAVDADGCLNHLTSSKVLKIEKYAFSIPSPQVVNGKLCIDGNTIGIVV